MNIQNLLDTGYFTTSRARSTGPSISPRPPPVSRPVPQDTVPPPVPAHGQVPRTVYLAPAPPSKKNFPPPATVEEEVESLAKEYGSSTPPLDSEEEPLSRGDVDQHPIIIEVHEHNPERRFVIVPENAKDQPPIGEQTTDVERQPEEHVLRDQSSSGRKPRPRETKHRDDADLSRYGLERRKSKQDLPPIDTGMDIHSSPQHHRTRSAATGPRPDYFDNRQSRPHGDHFLSPEIISNGLKGREKAYRGMPQSSGAYSARSPSRTSHQFESRDGGTERDYHGQDQQDRMSSARQSTTDLDSGRPRRRNTNDADPRSRDGYMQARSDKRDGSQAYPRPEGPRPRLSPRPSRDPSRSTDDHFNSPRDSGYLSSKPLVVQDAKPAGRRDRRDETSRHSRSTSRASTFPLTTAEATGAAASAMAYDASKAAFGEAAKPASRPIEQTARASKTQLPYPDDDPPPDVGLGKRCSPSEVRQLKGAEVSGLSMPEPSPIYPPGRSLNPTNGTSTTCAAVNTSQPWTPAPFDPEKDGLPTERSMGAYRRYSENHSKDGANILPECPRQKPIAGLVDWLTLPHTSFNICPTCYSTIFAMSGYRTLFKPILRPSDEPISCDFGVSPWYRIAWLLTLKDDVPDLRLLQQVANVGSASNREPCPGSKKATRSWLTVKDPRTRLPVDNFSVCYHCARIVELLLPNLTGVFEPLDSRPRTDKCALHFAPERKEFVLLFDVLETTSDKALVAKKPPDVDDLARQLWHLTVGAKCHEDTPVINGYWHTMQFLREFTVCGSCFEDVVKPKLGDGNIIARNFYMKPQRLPSATCQLYSARMREIFRRSCQANDPKYLEERVMQRRRKEKDIYDQLVKLDRANVSSSWKEEQVGKLVDEWKRWE